MIKGIDHIILTVRDINMSVEFYTTILGMKRDIFEEERVSLKFGNQKINLHKLNTVAMPKVHKPTVGSMDLCFIVDQDIEVAYEKLKRKKRKIAEGIVDRTGANGTIHSIYIYDPDDNLLELSSY